MEMMRRRERIEKWRAEKKKKETETLGKENEVGVHFLFNIMNLRLIFSHNIKEEAKPKEVKKWSLEEDDEDEEDVDANGLNGDDGDIKLGVHDFVDAARVEL